MRYLIIATDTEQANTTVYYAGAGGWTTSRDYAVGYTKAVGERRLTEIKSDTPRYANPNLVPR